MTMCTRNRVRLRARGSCVNSSRRQAAKHHGERIKKPGAVTQHGLPHRPFPCRAAVAHHLVLEDSRRLRRIEQSSYLLR